MLRLVQKNGNGISKAVTDGTKGRKTMGEEIGETYGTKGVEAYEEMDHIRENANKFTLQ